MRINYIYCITNTIEPYANIEVDLEVLNWLKSMVEDLIVDYARVQNFDGIDEAITVREELVRAINALTPEPIPEQEEQNGV
jgi:hypothetical protein